MTQDLSLIVLSNRIRVARNLSKYPFSIIINDTDSDNLKNDIKDSIFNNKNIVSQGFEYIDFNNINDTEKILLFENYTISQSFLNSKKNKALITSKDKNISIMINEEDHLRLQTLFSGDKIKETFKLALELDSFMEQKLDYAFDKKLGYLTSCPTNVGTGLRASFMIHIPTINNTNNLPVLINSISKFGMTIRGIFGEGTQPLGDIFQISNQVTIGKKEEDIINLLIDLTMQIMVYESEIARKSIKSNKIFLEDAANRAYGIVSNLRTVSLKESMELISRVRFGYVYNLIDKKTPKDDFYNIIINCRPATISSKFDRKLLEHEIDIKRADYLRSVFN